MTCQPPNLHVYTPDPLTRARARKTLRTAELQATFFRTTDLDAFARSSQTRRLELWIDCYPAELNQHARPEELLGLFIAAHDRRTVLCLRLDDERLDDQLATVALFHQLPVDQWNEPVCARCRCDATVQTEEGLWWCKRHSTRAWEPIEHREGVAWQEQRLPG
jgi:hypothetical protein